MPDSRKARRIADPGLQPERTSLAWFRTMLGYGALMALAIKHNWHQAGMLFWISIGILAIVALILAKYTSMEIGKALMVSDILIVLAAAVRFGGAGLYLFGRQMRGLDDLFLLCTLLFRVLLRVAVPLRCLPERRCHAGSGVCGVPARTGRCHRV